MRPAMLKNIPPLLSPDLLHALASMGHGDEIVLADAYFPAAALAQRLVRLPGIAADAALDAVLTLLPLDDFVPQPACTMQVVGSADEVPPAVVQFTEVLARHGHAAPGALDRYAFYERAAKAFVVVATGDTRTYANVLLKKGVLR